jgi:SH3-like domain-containing protein
MAATAVFAAVLACVSQTARAEAVEVASADQATAVDVQPQRGSETGLPIPRFVSLKSAEVNARRGPSLSHQVDWVFVRRGLPVEVIAEHGNWRKVRDHDGASGWVHHSLIRGARSVIVTAPEALLMDEPSLQARAVARAERGVLAWIEECAADWCEIEADGYDGWALKSALWGVSEDEVIK